MNLLNSSVVVISVTTADKDIDGVDNTYTPPNRVDTESWEACKSKCLFNGSARRQLMLLL